MLASPGWAIGRAHIHVIATDGVFAEGERFHTGPKFDEWAHRYLLSLWTKAIANFVVKHKFISPEMMGKILNWQHTGFSVFADHRVDFKKSDKASVIEMRHLARYISKPPFSLEKILWKPGSDRVIYRGTGLQKWHKQNFETYDVLDFLAALTSHIPNHRQKYVGYYGQYSNKTRGMQIIGVGESRTRTEPGASVEQAKFRQTWAMLIQKVWEVNPLECPKCGSPMKIVAIVEDMGLVEASLTRLGLWKELAPRGPPIDFTPPPEVEWEPWNEDLGVD